MTTPNGMPDNPGDPENTDPEATSADRAEQAAEEAAARQAEESPFGQASEEEILQSSKQRSMIFYQMLIQIWMAMVKCPL